MKRKLFGVGNYIKNLVWSLSEIDKENEYFIFGSVENACHLEGLSHNFHFEFAPSNRALRLPWEQTVFPLMMKKYGIDVYHGPTFIAPLAKTCNHVVSILDMTFHLTPERHSLHKRLYFKTMIPAMARRSDLVVAISESTKQDIVRLLGTPEEKITVIPLGVEPRFHRMGDIGEVEAVRRKYDLPRKFILFVGLIEPRKNLENLVDAYVQTNLSAEFDLVLAGSLGWDYAGLLNKISGTTQKNAIRMPGYIPDGDLPALYNAAEAFVYPSLYEGFGLPVLEAMACGTPVITSSVSSLPEVAGDAAVLVNPRRTSEIGRALETIVNNRKLRQDLSERARTRSQLFTWERTAIKTLEVYKRAAALEDHRDIPRADSELNVGDQVVS